MSNTNTVRIRKKSGYEQAMERINHPSHYTSGNVECIDAIAASMSREQFIGFLKGNVQKYLWRFDSKGVTDDMTEDQKNLVIYENLGKGEFYLKRLMRMYAPKEIGMPEYDEVEVSDENT